MTINATVFGNDWVLQAADRHISGGPTGTERNKAVVFMSERLRATVVYTGLANHPDSKPVLAPDGSEIDFNSTDVWLTDVLGDSAYINAPAHVVLAAIASSATTRWHHLPPDWAQETLLVSLAGWDVHLGEMIGGRVSNFLDSSGRLAAIGKQFTTHVFPRGKRATVEGWIDPRDREVEERHLDRIVRLDKSKKHVIDAVVSVVRRAAARAPDRVSPDPIVTWLPKEGEATAHYCPPASATLLFSPNYVSCTSQAVYVLAGGEMSRLPEGLSVRLGDDSKSLTMSSEVSPGSGQAVTAVTPSKNKKTHSQRLRRRGQAPAAQNDKAK